MPVIESVQMYLIIVGLGGIGKNLARLGVEHAHNVVVIDQEEARCSEVLEHYDVLAVTGNATDKTTLEEAGIERADVLIATTSDDSVNLMTCWLAKKFRVPNVVAIVNQPSHSDFFKEVGVRISENPDELVASRLYYWTQNPQLQQLASIPGGTIFEIVAEAGAPIVGHEIRELKVKDFVFIAIRRARGELIIPSGNVTINAGDIFTVFTKKEGEEDCLRLLNKQLKKSAE